MSDAIPLGFGLPVSGDWATPAAMVEVAQCAEELGYASLWSFQRVLHPAEGDRLPHRARDRLVGSRRLRPCEAYNRRHRKEWPMSLKDTAPTGGRSVSPKLVISVLVAVLALVFVFQNTGRGRVQFLFFELTAPAWLWFLGLFLAGVVVGSLFPWLRRHR